jgi:preprotein translocase subunit SecG
MMTIFILTLAITFSLLLLTAVLISYCKRRQNRTSHGLTGMCHKSGGAMSSCCSAQFLNHAAKNGKTPACRQTTLDE